MATPSPGQGPPDDRPSRFQYSMRALFGLTTAVAVVCSIFFALPAWVGALATVCVIISMPAVLTVMLIYGRGHTRTFAIGALFPAGVCLTPVVSHYGLQLVGDMLDEVFDSLEPNIALLVLLNVYFAVVLGNGLLAVWVRRLLEAGRPTAVPPSSAIEETPGTVETDAGAEETPGEAP